MNETIGAKGGSNDLRRQMRISQEQKKKLEEYEEEREIAELEKKVKKKQFYTLIKTLPIVIGGGTIQTLYDTATGKKRDTEDENSRWKIKEYDHDVTHLTPGEFEEQRRRKIITTPTGEKIVVFVEAPVSDKTIVEDTITENNNGLKDTVSEKTPEKVKPSIIGEILSPTPKSEKKEEKTEEKFVFDGDTKKKPSIGIGNDQVDIEAFIDQELSGVDLPSLSKEAQEKLGKLKSKKIVEEYERQLKDIRFELRQVIYEYNVLEDESDDVVLSRDAEIILDKLSDIIDRIEELKQRIKVEDLDQYDDQYIYYLIEGYLKDFHDKKIISEIEDSPLYIMISEKLDELEQRKDKFSRKVEDKKEKLEEREIDFDQIKKNYYSIDQLNNQLLEYQYDQNRILREIQEKVRNATTESERVQEEVVGMNSQSQRLFRMLSFQMFLPGPRFAKGLAASAAAYLYFMNNVIRPNTRTKRYKVIMVHDYHDEIKGNLESLEDAIRLLGKTSNQVDKMIIEIEDRYHDYLGVVPECDEILRNLKKIKSEIEEKEYEMKKIKQQQELELEKNDAKVKTIGEYAVN